MTKDEERVVSDTRDIAKRLIASADSGDLTRLYGTLVFVAGAALGLASALEPDNQVPQICTIKAHTA